MDKKVKDLQDELNELKRDFAEQSTELEEATVEIGDLKAERVN
jgi:cell division protein FtsL